MVENLSSDSTSKNSIYSDKSIKCIKPFNEKEDKTLSAKSKIISGLLEDICEERKSNSDSKKGLLKPFTTKKVPSISIKDYIDRLLKYSKAFKDITIIILIYLDSICAKHNIYLNYNNIHKFIFAAFIVAIKFHEDEHYSINYYAKLGGISKKDAINLEYEFMSLMDFNLFVDRKLFDKYSNYLDSLEEEVLDDDFDVSVN